MKNIDDRRVRKTKNLIKDALVKLLKDENIEQISVTELCDKADINRKTFYNHYMDIRNVLDEIENEYIDKYLSYLGKESILYDLSNPYPFVMRLTEEIDQNDSIYTIVTKGNEYIYIKEKIKNQLSKYLNQIGQKYPRLDHESLYFYIDFITAGIASVYQEWFLSDKKMEKEKLAKLISEIINGGSKALVGNLETKSV